jgi:hypothetical protein
MAIKRLQNGQYEVKTLKQAQEALRTMRELQDSIDQLMEEHGISEMMADAAEMKKAATHWAANTDTQRIDLGNGRKGEPYALLRRDKYGGTWLATDDDITNEAPKKAVSMLSVLRKKYPDRKIRSEVWNRITKRTIDKDGLQRVVDEGLLSDNEIAPAFYEKEKAPFLIVYQGK